MVEKNIHESVYTTYTYGYRFFGRQVKKLKKKKQIVMLRSSARALITIIIITRPGP